MKVKFLQDYRHTFKSFKKGDVCELFHGFAKELLEKKVVTDKLNKIDKLKIEKEKKDGNIGSN